MESVSKNQPALLRWVALRASHGLWAVLLSILVVGLAACGSESSREVSAEDRAAIESFLSTYLPLLGEAYESGNIEVLRPVAAEKEIATVYKRVSDLMAEGRILKPELIDFTIEDITPWNNSNAFVTTIEEWNLEVVAAGSEMVTSQREQTNRVKYQLKLKDGEWRVLFRTIETTF